MLASSQRHLLPLFLLWCHIAETGSSQAMTLTMAADDGWLNSKEAAAYLRFRVSAKTVKRWMEEGFVVTKNGGKLTVKLCSVPIGRERVTTVEWITEFMAGIDSANQRLLEDGDTIELGVDE